MSIDVQRGQAVVEALAAVACLGLLGTAAISIGRFQWQGLEAAHAARVQVFRYALGDRASNRSNPRVTRETQPADFPGPGGVRAAALRRELGVEDRGMVRADAAVRVVPHQHHGDGLVLRRHASILADAGHARDDAQAQQRIAASRAAWKDAAHIGHAPARQASEVLKGIDGGWGRPAPDLDWLGPWADLVPTDRLGRFANGQPGSADRSGRTVDRTDGSGGMARRRR